MTTIERSPGAGTDVGDVTWDLSHLLDGRDEQAVVDLLDAAAREGEVLAAERGHIGSFDSDALDRFISYASLSPELAALASRFSEVRWIDAPDRPGKRPGASCAHTVPSVHPDVYVYAYGQHEVQGSDFPSRYLHLLRAGGSMAPAALARIVGCDLGDRDRWGGGLRLAEAPLEAAEEAAAAPRS